MSVRHFFMASNNSSPSLTSIAPFLNNSFILSIYDNSLNFLPGDKIRFSTKLKTFRNFNNPGNYDYESAMRLQGLICNASLSDGRDITLLEKDNLGFPNAYFEKAKSAVRKFFKNTLPEDHIPIFRALILGEKEHLDYA